MASWDLAVGGGSTAWSQKCEVSTSLVPGQLDSPPGTARVRGQASLDFSDFCHEILAVGPVTVSFLVSSVTSATSGPGVGSVLAVLLSCKALSTGPGVTGLGGAPALLLASSWSWWLGAQCGSTEAGTRGWGRAVPLLDLLAGVSAWSAAVLNKPFTTH